MKYSINRGSIITDKIKIRMFGNRDENIFDYRKNIEKEKIRAILAGENSLNMSFFLNQIHNILTIIYVGKYNASG